MNKDMILEREVKDNMIINKQVNKKDSYINKFIKFNRRHLHTFILSFSLLIIISLSFLITFNVFIKDENNKAYANNIEGEIDNYGNNYFPDGKLLYSYNPDTKVLNITGYGEFNDPQSEIIWNKTNSGKFQGTAAEVIGPNVETINFIGDSLDKGIIIPHELLSVYDGDYGVLNPNTKLTFTNTFIDMHIGFPTLYLERTIKYDFKKLEGAMFIVPNKIYFNYNNSSALKYACNFLGYYDKDLSNTDTKLGLFEIYDEDFNYLGHDFKINGRNDDIKYEKVRTFDKEDSLNFYSYLFDAYLEDIYYFNNYFHDDDDKETCKSHIYAYLSMLSHYVDNNGNYIPINSNNQDLCDFQRLCANETDLDKLINDDDVMGGNDGKFILRQILSITKKYLISEGFDLDNFNAKDNEEYMADLFKEILNAIYNVNFTLDSTSNLNYFDIANVGTNLSNNKLNQIILNEFVYSFRKEGNINNPIIYVEGDDTDISPNIVQNNDDLTVNIGLMNRFDTINTDYIKTTFQTTSVGNIKDDSYMNMSVTITCKGSSFNDGTEEKIEIKSTDGNIFDYIYDVNELNSLLNEPGKTKTYNYQLNADLQDVYRIRTKIEVSTYDLNNDFDLTIKFDKTLYNSRSDSYPRTIKEGNYEIITSPYTNDQKSYANIDSYDDYKALFSNVYHIPETSEHCAYDVYEITKDNYLNINSECLFSSDVDFDLPVYTLGKRYIFLCDSNSLYDDNIEIMLNTLSSVYNNIAPNDENDKLVAPLDPSLITYDYLVNNFKESYVKVFADNMDYSNTYYLNEAIGIYSFYDFIYYQTYGVNLEGTTDPVTIGGYVPTPFDDYDDYIGYLAVPLKSKVDGSTKTTGNDKDLLLTSAGDGLDLVLEAKDFINNFSNGLKKSNISVKKLSLKNKNVYYSVNKKLVDDDNPITLEANDITVWYVNNKGKVVNLTYGSDYEIDNTSYKNNNKVGKASFKIVGLDPYVKDTMDAEFNIVEDPDKLKGRDTNYIPPNNDPTPTPDPKPDDKPSITTTTITIGGIVTDPNSTSGYIKGYGDRTIKPNDGITRAEFIKIMAETAPNFSINDQTNLSALSDYRDVNINSWYAPYAGYLAKCKVLTGYSDKTIKPNDKITRAEVCSIISNMYDPKASDANGLNTSNSFNSELDNMWYKDCVTKLVNAGIINGYDDGTFKPNNKITRAETVALVNRTLGINNAISDYQKQYVINNYNDLKESDWFFSDIARAIFNK